MSDIQVITAVCIVLLIVLIFFGAGCKKVADVSAVPPAPTVAVVESAPATVAASATAAKELLNDRKLVVVPTAPKQAKSSYEYDPNKPHEHFLDASGVQQSWMYYYVGYDPRLSGPFPEPVKAEVGSSGKSVDKTEYLYNPVQVAIDQLGVKMNGAATVKVHQGINWKDPKIWTKTLEHLTPVQKIRSADISVWSATDGKEHLSGTKLYRMAPELLDRSGSTKEHLNSKGCDGVNISDAKRRACAMNPKGMEHFDCSRVPSNDRERRACATNPNQKEHFDCRRTPSNDQERRACATNPKQEHLVPVRAANYAFLCNVGVNDIVMPTCGPEHFEMPSWVDQTTETIKVGARKAMNQLTDLIPKAEHLSYEECKRLGVRNPEACSGSPLRRGNPNRECLTSDFGTGPYKILSPDGRALTVVGSREYSGPDKLGRRIALLTDNSLYPGSMQLWTIKASKTNGYIFESRGHADGAMALTLGADGAACLAPNMDLPEQRFDIPNPHTAGLKQLKLLDGRCMNPKYGSAGWEVNFGACLQPGWKIVAFKLP